MFRKVIGKRDDADVTATYRIDIDHSNDIRDNIELSAAAKSPPPNHPQSNPKEGYQRVVWAETAAIKDRLVSHLDSKSISYTVADVTPSLSKAQSAKIDQIKTDAKDVLKHTDWYIVRKQETGESIPQSVIDHRAEVRSLSDQFESDVNALESVSEVQNYSFDYPEPPEP